MRRFVRAGLVVLVMLAGIVLPSTAAQACSCARLSDERMFRFSDAVFYGEVVGRSPLNEANAVQNSIHTVEVNRVYKGHIGVETRLIAGGDPNMCGIELTVGQSYLVFADTSKSLELANAAPDVYATSGCSGTRSATEATTDFGGGEPPSGALPLPATAGETGEPVDNTAQVWMVLIGASLLLVLLGTAVVVVMRARRRWEAS